MARHQNYQPTTKFEPRGRAFTTYLKHTGQIPKDQVKVPEWSEEEITTNIITRRRQWQRVLRQLGWCFQLDRRMGYRKDRLPIRRPTRRSCRVSGQRMGAWLARYWRSIELELARLTMEELLKRPVKGPLFCASLCKPYWRRLSLSFLQP